MTQVYDERVVNFEVLVVQDHFCHAFAHLGKIGGDCCYP